MDTIDIYSKIKEHVADRVETNLMLQMDITVCNISTHGWW